MELLCFRVVHQKRVLLFHGAGPERHSDWNSYLKHDDLCNYLSSCLIKESYNNSSIYLSLMVKILSRQNSINIYDKVITFGDNVKKRITDMGPFGIEKSNPSNYDFDILSNLFDGKERVSNSIYAIVLLDQGIYQGHCYFTISEENSIYTLMTAARCRTDILLSPGNLDELAIYKYLEEGASRFGLLKNSKKLILVNQGKIQRTLLVDDSYVLRKIPSSITEIDGTNIFSEVTLGTIRGIQIEERVSKYPIKDLKSSLSIKFTFLDININGKIIIDRKGYREDFTVKDGLKEGPFVKIVTFGDANVAEEFVKLAGSLFVKEEKTIANYVKDKRHGKFKVFNNDKIIKEVEYCYGRKIGFYHKYLGEKLISISIFEDGIKTIYKKFQ